MSGAKPDKQIRAALLNYCRGIDRLDLDTLMAAFHPGAMLEGYGPKAYVVEKFAPFAMNGLRDAYAATQHRLSNITIDRHDNKARVETYVLAFHVVAGEQRQLVTFNGRYIDDFENLEGFWRIRTRRLRQDWSSTEPLNEPMRGTFMNSSRDHTDVLYSTL